MPFRAAANLSSSPVLLDTFGPGGSYTAGSGWTLGFDSGSSWVQAIGFVPTISGAISRHDIAVVRNSGGTRLDAWLLSDSNNQPGLMVEQLSFSVPPGVADLRASAASTLHPSLVAGTRCWLVVAPPDLATELFGWYRNPRYPEY